MVQTELYLPAQEESLHSEHFCLQMAEAKRQTKKPEAEAREAVQ